MGGGEETELDDAIGYAMQCHLLLLSEHLGDLAWNSVYTASIDYLSKTVCWADLADVPL